jgi:hypothetical protein
MRSLDDAREGENGQGWFNGMRRRTTDVAVPVAFAVFFASFLALSLLGTGCATPQPIIRLDPRSTDIFWVAGRPSIQREATGIRAAVAFERQNGQVLGVRVEVENLTAAPLDVKPQDFSYVVCSAETAASCGPAKRIIDPENVLAELDTRASRETAAAINDSQAWTALVLLSAVGEVGAAARGRARGTTGLQTAEAANQMQNVGFHHDRVAAQIADQRQQWADVALRRNTLFPGQGVAGLVYIPTEVDGHARFVWLTERAGGSVIPFCFEQVVTPVAPAPWVTEN